MKVVCNASPLISLARLDQLALLPTLFGEVQIAAEVYQEVVVAGAGRPAAQAVQAAAWLRVQPCPDPAKLAEWRIRHPLGLGELATVLLAQSLKADLVVIDERAARRLAAQQGLKVIGCVGILEAGHRQGLVADLRGAYAQMLAVGVRIHPEILNRSLTAFGLKPL